jgi:hypothetical protein
LKIKKVYVGYALKSQLQEVGKFWVHLRLGAIVCVLLDCYCLPAPGRRPQMADSVLRKFCGKLVFEEYLT